MKARKRDGTEEEFNIVKIINAIKKANKATEENKLEPLTDEKFEKVLKTVEKKLEPFSTVSVEDIQDMVEDSLIKHNCYDVAKCYIKYREMKKQNKKFNSIEEQAISLVNGTNDELRGDNANKRVDLNSSQRDYLAGIVCKSLAKKTLSKDIVQAHNDGWIHYHDLDYSPLMHLHNCDLINVEDMLKNGFQMGDVHIDTPKTFTNACNLLAQINLIVSGSQYGGATVSWSHLLFIVERSREYYRKVIFNLFKSLHISWIPKKIKNNIVEFFVKQDIHTGIKTYQYQILCHSSSNGQTPFVSNNLCLREAETEQELKDFAFIIEEIFKRRIKGVKNESGKYISPLFPKLLYWQCEGLNVEKTDPYYYLTELACECVAKRMQPDFKSEKMCRNVKHGQIIPSMGAVRGDGIVSIKIEDTEYNNITIEKAFKLVAKANKLKGGFIYDTSSLQNKIGVYKITHIPSGKYYVGSSKNVGRRCTEHRYSIRRKGCLGDNYFINDFDVNNFKFDLLEECNLDNILECEFSYTNLNDTNCVNHKDCRNNGNFTHEFSGDYTVNHGKYSTFENRGYSLVEKVGDNKNIFVKSNNQWIPIRSILRNDPKKSHFDMYEITFIRNGIENKISITQDHPLHTQNGRVIAENLTLDDYLFDSVTYDKCQIVKIEKTNEECFTYDFEVDNDLFDLNGIISHNCRSLLSDIWEETEYPIETKFYYQFNEKDNVHYEDAYGNNFNYDSSHKSFYNDLKDAIYICENEKSDLKNIIVNFRGNSGWVISHTDTTVTILKPIVYGRWNEGVVSLNLPMCALKSKTENLNFYDVLDEKMELCRKALHTRHESICKIIAKNSPILWQHGALYRLNANDRIEDLIKKHPQRPSISLGFAGLCETCWALINKSNTSDEGQKLCCDILTHINNKLDLWKKEDGLNYALYGTPEENLTSKFSMALQKNFGLIEHITDKDYVVNSYHIDPREQIDAFSKLKIESQYLNLCKGGAVSYIEVPNMTKNINALKSVVRYMYDNIYYAEINTKLDTCYKCGFQGEIELTKTSNGNFKFKCPNCGNENDNEMNCVRRICGYLGTVNSGNTNHGRLDDIYNRVLHL